ncbi:dicarboxylate/amino acid:cation symporter [Pseudobacteriovorax antillogorgiicola]|uniref:Na+/H+-dicarboxylate symporter n=1 Tax=Pseudobacteriovorax antillogorgiicola TaxID=1513793 RepID=A0A1Y6CID5_9BACT|nr:dicarboxylate/amino acid:cation symporter [Pseudobacteriovorax antillogorgiicola]TCS48321.1 Na+/H+-dicarboxylate symporter [Pseudobacteriovorax antillogorgiicola]SMF56603.1 Na+/H+-dicarboxylate symporter [Pseudobacteriovorax antillogorgiicola]
MKALQNKNLTRNIILAMALGIAVGILLSHSDMAWTQTYLVDGAFHVGGQIFIRSLKMLVVPLVFVSLIEGVTSLSDLSQLGRVGGKTLALYLMTTAIAISMAISFGLLVSPGQGIELSSESQFVAKEAPGFGQILIDLIPANPLEAMTQGNMLQVIMFAILIGLGINIQGKKASSLLNFVKEANGVVMVVLSILMLIAPFGVFCLVAKIFATLGFSAILPLAKYFLVVVAALICQVTLVYTSILKVFSGLNPMVFIRKFREVWLYAFSTASSNATLPITLKTVEEKLGVHNKIASFSIPLGATINMDGTAIMQGVATVFIAQAYQVDLAVTDFLMVVLTATMASVGTAGVPGVGLITLAMVLNQVGLPVEGIGLIIGIDRLLDMMRTAVNVTGDATVSCIVAKSEKALDTATFSNKAHASG